MREQRGYLYYDTQRKQYGIDWRQTLSIVVGELLLREILAASRYLRGKLLDIGCGKRPYSLIYSSLVEQSIGTEVPFSLNGIDAADLLCYVEAMPFTNASYDSVLCTEVLEHTHQPFQAMQEISRILKPGGYLLLSVPFIYPIHEAPHDHWRFTTWGLEQICQSTGFRLVYIHSKGSSATALFVVFIILLVKGLNFFSHLLRTKKPLRDVTIFRWSLYITQRAWLGLRDLIKRGSSYTPWLTSGYFLLAQKTGTS